MVKLIARICCYIPVPTRRPDAGFVYGLVVFVGGCWIFVCEIISCVIISLTFVLIVKCWHCFSLYLLLAGRLYCLADCFIIISSFRSTLTHAQDGLTALMWACRNGHADCAQMLLDSGADKNVTCQVRVAARVYFAERSCAVMFLNFVDESFCEWCSSCAGRKDVVDVGH